MGRVQSTPVYFGPVSESIFPSPVVRVCVCQCHAYNAGLYIDSATTLLTVVFIIISCFLDNIGGLNRKNGEEL